MIYYHGTTTTFIHSINKNGLLPPTNTNNKCENRHKNLNHIYLTDEKEYAIGYALRAILKYNGRPYILEINDHKCTLGIKEERVGRVNQYVVEKVPYCCITKEEIMFDLTDDRQIMIDKMVSIFCK